MRSLEPKLALLLKQVKRVCGTCPLCWKESLLHRGTSVLWGSKRLSPGTDRPCCGPARTGVSTPVLGYLVEINEDFLFFYLAEGLNMANVKLKVKRGGKTAPFPTIPTECHVKVWCSVVSGVDLCLGPLTCLLCESSSHELRRRSK